MAEKLKIIPLGGLNEIGKNMTVLEYGKDIIIIDCGLGFPEDDMYGIDLVIADMTYLVKNQEKIRGMFLTHGHEDHIGGIPYAMQQFNCPIHGTRLTAGLVKLKLEEHHLERRVKLFTHEAGEVVKAGCFQVEFIHVNHSIADAVAFAVKTPVGTLVFSGDFKIDAMAEDGMIDLARFAQLGRNVFQIAVQNDREAAMQTIDAMEAFFRSIGMPTCFTELGIGVLPEEQLRKLADNCSFHHTRTISCFKTLDAEDMYKIYKMSNH